MKQKNKKFLKISLCTLLTLLTAFTLCMGVMDALTPDSISVRESDMQFVQSVQTGQDGYVFDYTAKVFGLIPIKNVNVNVVNDTRLIPSGDVFGVKFFTKGIIIIGMSEIETEDSIVNPAQSAGLQIKDIITHVNGKEINSIEEMTKAVENSDGKTLNIVYERDGEEYTALLTPKMSLNDNAYKTGIWVRDSTAGIGTVTFYDPENKVFAGLGHGICDVDTGKLMPLLKGSIVDVKITQAIKGERGAPGELKGTFGTFERGKLIKNTSNGVFGVMEESPECLFDQPLEIALRNELKEGKATVYCNVDGNGVKEYEIEITKIYKNSEDGKNFVVSITDKALLNITGGIIQGMSGSPIVQNGKLVGAVTHVLVNDPHKGYGIFIENMLAEAEKIK